MSYELKGLSLVSWESYPQLKGEAKGQTALWTAGEVSLPLLVCGVFNGVWKYPTEIRRWKFLTSQAGHGTFVENPWWTLDEPMFFLVICIICLYIYYIHISLPKAGGRPYTWLWVWPPANEGYGFPEPKHVRIPVVTVSERRVDSAHTSTIYQSFRWLWIYVAMFTPKRCKAKSWIHWFSSV